MIKGVGKGIQLFVGGSIHYLILCGIGPFLTDIIAEHGGVVGKHIVARKLRFGNGNQPFAILHVMNTIDGDATCLDKRRTERHTGPDLHAILPKHLTHHIGFQREMAAQTGVATADEDEPITQFAVYFQHRFHGRTHHASSLFARHGPGIGEHIEERLLVLQGHPDGSRIPLGNQQTAVDGLNAGRVIVEDDQAVFFIEFHCSVLRYNVITL